MRVCLVVAIVLAIGCKKKQQDPEVTQPVVVVVDAGVPDAALAFRKLPPSEEGVAIALSSSEKPRRLDGEGWKELAIDDATAIVGDVDGTPIAVGSSIWRITGDRPVEVPGVKAPTHVASTPDGLWALAGSALYRETAGAFVPEKSPGEDPPRGLASGRDGAVWIHTLDRTFRRDAGSWKEHRVSGVTGTTAEIAALVSHPRGDTYVLSSVGLYRWHVNHGRRMDSRNAMHVDFVAGPDGRHALIAWGETSVELADERGVIARPKLEGHPDLQAFDDRGRLWMTGDNGIQVLRDGKIVHQWSAEEVGYAPAKLAVLRGGPVLGAGERAGGTVTGKVEGSAGGITVLACSASARDARLGEDPCEGDAQARRTRTTAGGRFVLSDVALQATKFFIKRGDWWRRARPVECCAALKPGGTQDLGVLAIE